MPQDALKLYTQRCSNLAPPNSSSLPSRCTGFDQLLGQHVHDANVSQRLLLVRYESRALGLGTYWKTRQLLLWLALALRRRLAIQYCRSNTSVGLRMPKCTEPHFDMDSMFRVHGGLDSDGRPRDPVAAGWSEGSEPPPGAVEHALFPKDVSTLAFGPLASKRTRSLRIPRARCRACMHSTGRACTPQGVHAFHRACIHSTGGPSPFTGALASARAISLRIPHGYSMSAVADALFPCRRVGSGCGRPDERRLPTLLPCCPANRPTPLLQVRPPGQAAPAARPPRPRCPLVRVLPQVLPCCPATSSSALPPCDPATLGALLPCDPATSRCPATSGARALPSRAPRPSSPRTSPRSSRG